MRILSIVMLVTTASALALTQVQVATFEYLKHAVNETRDSLGAEPCDARA